MELFTRAQDNVGGTPGLGDRNWLFSALLEMLQVALLQLAEVLKN